LIHVEPILSLAKEWQATMRLLLKWVSYSLLVDASFVLLHTMTMTMDIFPQKRRRHDAVDVVFWYWCATIVASGSEAGVSRIMIVKWIFTVGVLVPNV
jgi:hypothetical protein